MNQMELALVMNEYGLSFSDSLKLYEYPELQKFVDKLHIAKVNREREFFKNILTCIHVAMASLQCRQGQQAYRSLINQYSKKEKYVEDTLFNRIKNNKRKKQVTVFDRLKAMKRRKQK